MNCFYNLAVRTGLEPVSPEGEMPGRYSNQQNNKNNHKRITPDLILIGIGRLIF